MFELDDARRDELVEKWAHMLVDRGFGVAGVFLLEAHKPLSGFGAHAALAFQPLITPLINLNVNEVAAFMRRTENVEMLIRRVEALEHERNAVRDAADERRREIRRRARRIKALRRHHDR